MLGGNYGIAASNLAEFAQYLEVNPVLESFLLPTVAKCVIADLPKAGVNTRCRYWRNVLLISQ